MLKVELFPTERGPGYAKLTISGAAGNVATLAIQRNQDQKYLAEGRAWTTTHFWHDLSQMQKARDGVEGEVGPALVDSILSSPNVAYLAHVRANESAPIERAVIVVRPGVLASSAAGDRDRIVDHGEGIFASAAPMATQVTEDLPEVESIDTVEDPIEPEPSIPEPPAPPKEDSSNPLKLILIGIGVLLALLLIGALVWFFVLNKEPTPEPPKTQDPAETETVTEPTESAETVISPCSAESLADVGGTEFLRNCVNSSPSSQAILDAVETLEAKNECDSARRMLTYVSQKGDNDVAFAYAQKLDPEGFTATNCFQEADADTAAYWYEGPALDGNLVAKRRLGALLAAEGPGSTDYRRGLDMLSELADDGDVEAEELLDQLTVD